MKYILLLILLTQVLFSQDLLLDNLLKEYEDSESLYKKTKKENAGFLLIYSRADLEKMQAYSLQDVLKTTRAYTLQTNRTGAISILNAGAGKAAMPPIKLYIDDVEISTVTQRNALDMYGNMNIYFVDHIEIYQGGSSIAFGNEPGSMVIRLYSKNPQRENSTSIEASVDSESGGALRVLDAGVFGEYNYLAYASVANQKFDTYSTNGQTLSRDAKQYQAHFKFAKENDFTIELDGIINKTDIFKGFGVAPTGDESKRAYGYLSAIKYFPNDLELSMSISQETKRANNTDAINIANSINNKIYMNVYSNTYKTALKKKVVNGKNDFLMGIEFQKKIVDVHDYEGITHPANKGTDELDIYMIFIEEMYNINENHLISLSAKLDRYESNYSEDSNEYALRLGYTGILNNNFSTKLFATRRYVYPTTLQTSFTPAPYYANPDLEASEIDMLSGEIEYNNDKSRLVFGFAYKELDKALVMGKIGGNMMYVNSDTTNYIHRYYLRGEYKFDYDNKVILEGFKLFKDGYYSPGSGGLIQIFNTFKKFDIYNELVYREDYSLNYGAGEVKMDAGYDYTLAISYNVSKKLKIKAKGENLLDKASETLIDTTCNVKVPAIQRRAILTMEYTF